MFAAHIQRGDVAFTDPAFDDPVQLALLAPSDVMKRQAEARLLIRCRERKCKRVDFIQRLRLDDIVCVLQNRCFFAVQVVNIQLRCH